MKLWKKLLIAVFAAIVLFLAVEIITTWPVYPAFTKEVDSYDALCKPFRNSKTVFLPDEDDVPVSSYTLLLDGRSIFAKPETYCIQKSEDLDDLSVRYDLVCRTHGETPCSGTLEYRGVPYDVVVSDSPSESGTWHFVHVAFDIEGVFYRFSAEYQSDELTAEDEKAIQEPLRTRLETYAKQVIDKYSAAMAADADRQGPGT